MRQPYRIEAIALKDVGVFDDIRIDFPMISSEERDADKAEIHLFTGPNGCGKSTLLYALAEMFDIPSLSSLVKQRFRNQNSVVDFKFANEPGIYCVSKPAVLANEFGTYALIRDDPSNGSFFGAASTPASSIGANLASYKSAVFTFNPTQLHSQTRFAFAAFAYSGQRTLNNVAIGAIQEVTNSPFENALSFDATVRPRLLLQWIANNRTKAALARADHDDAAAHRYDQALERITDAITEISGMAIEFRLERSPLAVTVRLNDDVIQFDGLPDGLKSIISWIADLSMRLESIPWVENSEDVFTQPIILFLDEIDIHLHPKWQRRILPTVQRLFPNAQIFVSTHSPFVVASVEDACVYRLPEKGTQGNRIIEPLPSGGGKSYRLILEEIFGIDEEFDIETETLFDRFYELRDEFLRSPGKTESLRDAARLLAAKSSEARAIAERELRQVSRVSGVEIALV
ncbi:MAG: AAA family ATPase [Sulfuritalea sp.]|nr:AAA family ATPase [Sulfuritalea sp.]